MEEKLDQICLGKLDWLIVCQDCLNDIQEQLSIFKKERNNERKEQNKDKAGSIKIDKDNVFIISKTEYTIDATNRFVKATKGSNCIFVLNKKEECLKSNKEVRWVVLNNAMLFRKVAFVVK